MVVYKEHLFARCGQTLYERPKAVIRYNKKQFDDQGKYKLVDLTQTDLNEIDWDKAVIATCYTDRVAIEFACDQPLPNRDDVDPNRPLPNYNDVDIVRNVFFYPSVQLDD